MDTIIDINNLEKNNDIPIQNSLRNDTSQNQVINMTQTNNWNSQNENTLRNWKTSLVQSIFIYQFILDKTQIKFDRILFTTEILSGLSMIISAISATILSVNKGLSPPTLYNITSPTDITVNGSAIDYIVLALSICVAVLSITITVITRIIKIYKWDTNITSYTSFISSMDHIYSAISVELTKPNYLRTDGIVFINNMSLTYSDLIKNSPNLDIQDQEEAGAQYAKYIDGNTTNFNITQKYAYNDNNISVI
jgi:hypothetical protein